MAFPRNGLYRYWITPVVTYPGSSCINVRKLNPENATASTPEGSEIVVGDESVGFAVKRQLDILDARRRPKLTDPDRCGSKQQEVQYYTDIGYVDGLPYQGDAVIIIKIPFSRLRSMAQKIYDLSASMQDVSVDIKDIIYQNYQQTFSETGLLDFDELVAAQGWSDEEQGYASDHIQFIDTCYQEAQEKIRQLTKKYIAFGVFPIIIYKDE